MSAQPEQPPLAALTTRKVTVNYEFDGGPARYRIGLLALDNDVATEFDFHRMLPEDVIFYTTRVPCPKSITVENLRKIGPFLTAATKLLTPGMRLDSIAYSCTSGTVALTPQTVTELIHAGDRPDVPVATPVTSAVEALEFMGIKRISLLTPYLDSVNQAMRAFFEAGGIEVLNIGGFCLEDGNEMSEIPPEAIYQAALETCREDADGLFISCTAIRAVQILDRAEEALGKPVLSSIQTLFWQALRAAGYQKPLEGCGSLMRKVD